MLSLWQLLIFILPLVDCRMRTDREIIPQLTPPFMSHDLSNRQWDFGGSSVVDNWHFIRLTPDIPSKTGYVASSSSFNVKEKGEFEAIFSFKITGNDNTWFGDGLAFWLTSEEFREGPLFGGSDDYHGLGIFVDAYRNGRKSDIFPLISIHNGKGKEQTPYDYAKDGKDSELGYCSIGNLRRREKPTKIRLIYSYAEKELTVEYTKADKLFEFYECAKLKNVELPDDLFLAVSAHTGELSENHDLYSVQVNQRPRNPSAAKGRTSSQRSTFSKILIWSSVLFTIGGLVYVMLKRAKTQAKKTKF